MSANPYDSKESKLHWLAEVTRRQFIGIFGGLVLLGSFVLGGLESFKFLVPNATSDPPAKFIITLFGPSDVAVDNPQMDYTNRVGVILDDAGFYCVHLVCTHLGCTPNYTSDVVENTPVLESTAETYGIRKPSEKIPNGWACPCHGSRYFIDSTNFYGPAPRPMDWVDITLTNNGTQFLVDTGTLVVTRNPGQTTKPLWRMDPKTGLSNGKTLGV